MDTHQMAGLAVPAAFSLALVAVPAIARTSWLWLLCLVAAAGYYWREFLGFVLVSAIAYLAVRWLSKEPVLARRWRWACLLILALAVIFTCGRIEHWDRTWSFPLTGPLALYSLGMWPTLKLVTLFWEVGSGSIAVPSLLQYVVWTCLPFTLGGPVLRWSQMPRVVSTQPEVFRSGAWWLEAATATAKMVGGLSLGPAHELLASHWHSHFGNNAILTFVTGPISFYLTTAGYFHWMELLGRPCGIKLPESFNSPIGRENISAFWMNWNMTATFVFRDYLFYNRWGRRSYNIYFNTILLFTLVGLWHDANAYWVLWGFLHGLLFVTYLFWRKFGQRWGNIPLRGTRMSQIGVTIYLANQAVIHS
jgi:D-alanyl-lipoteichoic acid acyltransferase DltB (MBOAT superfamily)